MVASDGQPAGQGPDAFRHRPVMVDEVVEIVRPIPDGTFLDGTLGGGGHASAILEAHPGLHLVGVDRDGDAIEAAGRHLADHADRVTLVRQRFDQLDAVLEQAGREQAGLSRTGSQHELSGFLFDLGVSSPQLDRADRGFSFRHPGPLDMRMDRDGSLRASDVVNSYDENQLADLIKHNSDERNARRIAAAIVANRPIATTAQLAEVVAAAIPAPARRRGGHPARRTFQAIRIEVNDELDILGPALEQVLDALVPGGRGLVITYHSGEDRITKNAFRRRTTGQAPPGLPIDVDDINFDLIRPIARKASAQEQQANPRSTSARLRAIERRAA